MLGRTLVFSGGKTELDFAAEYLAKQSFDTVVCADSGLNAADALQIPVDYLMGDFDSVAPEILQKYQNGKGISRNPKWVQYPPEKDFTDTQLVLDWIVEQGANEIVILGATGGRLDHFLANLNLLMIPLKQQIPAWIIDSCNKLYLIDRDTVITRDRLYGKYISLQPLTSEVSGITLRGFRYLLDNFTMKIGTGLGVSNELAQGVCEASIELKDGILIVTESRDSARKKF